MKQWDADDAWESEDGLFVSIEDHEQVVEQFMAVIRMVGVGILDSRRRVLDEARAAVAALPTLTAVYPFECVAADEALAAIDALRSQS